MGFDNECILNIQSLPGEYFCPVCRTLIYPNEALQSQCTHLYCKPCLAYIVATTHACPYDGYLVTEADSKPLIESNKPLADTIGNVSVYCLYHRSGCQWQGTLSDCITHCTDCNFGDSPVVCNRCGTQIMHRQVQEHSLSCPGLQPQSQQADNIQPQAAEVTNQGVIQDSSSATVTTAASTATATTAASSASAAVPVSAPAASAQGQSQGNTVAQPQSLAQAPTPEQWYQQQQQQLQYQQYYQQLNPGYDPYQQQYQQYGQYQQQYVQQYPQPGMHVPTQHVVEAQQQPQPFMPPQVHPQPQAQSQTQAQPQTQAQAMQLQLQQQTQAVQSQHQPQSQVPVAQGQTQAQNQVQAAQPQVHHLPQMQSQPHPNPQPQHHPHVQPPQMQAPPQQSHLQPQVQTHPPHHAPLPGHPHSQPQHPPIQPHPQAQPPQFQARPPSQLPQQHPQSQMLHQYPHAQHQPHPHPHAHPRPPLQQPAMQMQPHPQANTYPQPQPQPQSIPQNPSAQAVTGHQSFPQPQPFQQAPPGSMQQRPMHMHPQPQPATFPPQPVQMQSHFPSQQPPHLRPPSAALPMQGQQQPAILPPQGPRPVSLPVQQPAHHPTVQPGQQIYPQSGMQPVLPQHALPQQHMHGHLYPSQTYQQEPFPPQHVMQPQQSLRSQGPPLQQHIPPQSHMQQNGPSTQGLLVHQAHNVTGRPMVVNQGMLPHALQAPSSGSSKFVQPGVTQQLPNKNYLENTGNSAISAKLHQGAMQHSQLPLSNSQEPSKSASSRPQSGTDLNQHGNTNEAGQVLDLEGELAAENAEGTVISNPSHLQMEGSKSSELKIPKNESDFNSVDDETKINPVVKEKGSQFDLDGEDAQESAHLSGKVHDVKNENVDEPVLKQVIEGEEEKIGSDIKGFEGDKKFEGQDGQSNENTDAQGGGGDASLLSHGTQKVPQHISEPGASDSGTSQQSSVSQRGFYDQNSSQHISQVPGPDEVRLIPSTGQLPGQDSFGHHIPYARPPGMLGHPMSSQRPPAPSDMFPQHMPHPDPNQIQKFQGPPPNQIQLHGQPFAPNQMRPPAPNFAEGLPHHGQPSVADAHPTTGRQAYGSFRPEVAQAGIPGPLFPSAAVERVPGHVGLPLRGYEGPSMLPHGQTHVPPAHAGGTSFLQGGPPVRPIMRGPLPRPLDMPSGVMARGPFVSPADQMGQSYPADALESPEFGMKRPGSFAARQPEPHHHGPGELITFGQPSLGPSSAMKINGKLPIGGMHDSDVAHGLEERFRHMPEERFRPLPEEGLNIALDERSKHPALETGRRVANQREFEEDLKKFPRPGCFDDEGMSMGRGPQAFGANGATGPRLLPPYQSGGTFLAGNDGSSLIPVNIGERHRPFGFHDDLSRRPDRAPIAEFGQRHMDGLPPRRSPGREFTGRMFGEYGMRAHMEDLEARERHGFGERSNAFNFSLDSLGNPFHEGRIPKASAARSGAFHDVSGNLRMVEQFGSGLPGYKRNELDGPDTLHSQFRSSQMFGSRSSLGRFRSGESLGQGNPGFGDLHSHSRFNEPAVPGEFNSNLRSRESVGGGNFPGTMRIGEPGFRSSYPLHGFPSDAGHYGSDDMEPELSRKQKPGTMGWCRICKIDCETVEGLDMHSQTREHQQMAMDMVLSIKKENARKQKLTSESTVSPEDASKPKKANCEIRGN